MDDVSEQPTPGQHPYQNPYGGPAYSPYQVGPTGVPYGPPPDHPQAQTVLILGILGIALCGLLGIVAWVLGTRVVREIDASGGTVGGRSNANLGRILGLVATGLAAIGVLVGLGSLALIIATAP